LDATTFGPCCPQPSSSVFIPKQDEQCLYLNIYKPLVASNNSLLPVLVWIHGGAHSIGCSSQDIPLLFNGTNMIAYSPPNQQAIVITINYRLGVLADMFLEELIEEDPQWPTAGNYMYLDMLSALRWIQKNIGDYGGDSGNVTIFGQSAGGLSVVDLGAVRGSSGLYRSTISQSGLASPGTYTSYYNMSDALTYSNSLVERVNCSSESKDKVLSCLRNTSIEELITAHSGRYTRPIIEDHFFPLYPLSAIKNGSYNNISLIMGNNDYEQPICYEHPDLNVSGAIEIVKQNVPSEWISFVLEYYNLNRCSSDRSANSSRCCEIIRYIAMDKIFDCDIRRLFNAFYTRYGSQYENNRLFSYHMNCYPTCPTVSYEGICRHSSELPFVFGTVSDADSEHLFNCTWDSQSRQFSNGVIAQWTSIASTGRPLSSWPSYDPTMPKFFHLTPDQGFVAESWNRNCSFFDIFEEQGAREAFANQDSFSKRLRHIFE